MKNPWNRWVSRAFHGAAGQIRTADLILTNLTGRFPSGLYSCYFPLSCVGSIYAPQYAVPISPYLSPLIPPERPKCFQICFQFSRRHKQIKMRKRENLLETLRCDKEKSHLRILLSLLKPRVSFVTRGLFSFPATNDTLILNRQPSISR